MNASNDQLSGNRFSLIRVLIPVIIYVDFLAIAIKMGWDRRMLRALDPRDPTWFPTPYGTSARYVLFLASVWFVLDLLWAMLRRTPLHGAVIRTAWLMVGMLVLLASQAIVPVVWRWCLAPDLLAAPSSLPRILVASGIIYVVISAIYSGIRRASSDNQP